MTSISLGKWPMISWFFHVRSNEQQQVHVVMLWWEDSYRIAVQSSKIARPQESTKSLFGSLFSLRRVLSCVKKRNAKNREIRRNLLWERRSPRFLSNDLEDRQSSISSRLSCWDFQFFHSLLILGNLLQWSNHGRRDESEKMWIFHLWFLSSSQSICCVRKETLPFCSDAKKVASLILFSLRLHFFFVFLWSFLLTFPWRHLRHHQHHHLRRK